MHWLKLWKDLHSVELSENKYNIRGLFMCACVQTIYMIFQKVINHSNLAWKERFISINEYFVTRFWMWVANVEKCVLYSVILNDVSYYRQS
jgi:hypothetical protein